MANMIGIRGSLEDVRSIGHQPEFFIPNASRSFGAEFRGVGDAMGK